MARDLWPIVEGEWGDNDYCAVANEHQPSRKLRTDCWGLVAGGWERKGEAFRPKPCAAKLSGPLKEPGLANPMPGMPRPYAITNSQPPATHHHTQPVGLGNPAILHAPLAGPLGNSS